MNAERNIRDKEGQNVDRGQISRAGVAIEAFGKAWGISGPPAQNASGITRDWDDEEISSLARAIDVCGEAER